MPDRFHRWRILTVDVSISFFTSLKRYDLSAQPNASGVFSVIGASLVGAWIGALCSGLSWSAVEASNAATKATPFLGLWQVTSYTSIIIAVLLTVVIGIGTALLSKLTPYLYERLGRPGLMITGTWLTFWTVVGYVSYGLTKLAQRVFSAPEIHAIFLGLGLPVLIVLGALGTTKFARWLDRRFMFYHAPKTVLLFALVWLGIWGGSFALLEPQVYANLGASWITPLLLSLFATTILAIFMPLTRASVALAIALLLPAGLGVMSGVQASKSTMARAAEYTHLSAKVLKQIRRKPPRKSSKPLKAGQVRATASCYPEVNPPTLADIEPIDPKKAPDIIFVTVDALRWDHTIWSKYARKTNPHATKFARHGALFHKAFTPATSTRQTIGAYFTGVHPSQRQHPKAKRWNLSLNKGQETLASYLKKAGYHTVAVLMATHIFQKKYRALHGFNVSDAYPKKAAGRRKYAVPFQVDRIIAHLTNPKTHKKPKFIWTHIMESHQPYKVGPTPVRYGKGQMAKYDASIHYVDSELKRLFDFVRSSPRRKNTYIVLTADHGQAFKEHANVLHGMTVHQEEAHVPLLIVGPKIKPRSYKTPISTLTVYPTIFDMAGLTPPKSACARSVLPVLQSKTAVLPKEPVYLEVIPDFSRAYLMNAFVDGDWKLINKPNLSIQELYNIKVDPKEKNNLASKEPARLKTMNRKLKAYLTARGIDLAPFDL